MARQTTAEEDIRDVVGQLNGILQTQKGGRPWGAARAGVALVMAATRLKVAARKMRQEQYTGREEEPEEPERA